MDEVAWRSTVDQSSEDVRVGEEIVEFRARSTLAVFAELKLSQSRIPQYLNDRSNVQGVQLLTKCRLGYLWLMKPIARTVKGGGVSAQCRLCHFGQVEDVEHFLLQCPVLDPCRRQLEHRLDAVLPGLGKPGAELLARYYDGREGRLRVLLGDLSVEYRGVEDDAEDHSGRSEVGKAKWFVDKNVKNFLVVCWRVRESVLGSLTVQHGQLVSESSKWAVEEVLDSQVVCGDVDVSQVWDGSRKFWSEWMPQVERKGPLFPPYSVKRGPCAFYAVKKGRSTGIFYRWVDCMRSIAGVEDRVFCGRRTLQEVQEWMCRS
jgi:hypothetical protein